MSSKIRCDYVIKGHIEVEAADSSSAATELQDAAGEIHEALSAYGSYQLLMAVQRSSAIGTVEATSLANLPHSDQGKESE